PTFSARRLSPPISASMRRSSATFRSSVGPASDSTVRRAFIRVSTSPASLAQPPLTGNANIASATLFQTKLALYTSYVVAANVPKDRVPDVLMWDTADPYHY